MPVTRGTLWKSAVENLCKKKKALDNSHRRIDSTAANPDKIEVLLSPGTKAIFMGLYVRGSSLTKFRHVIKELKLLLFDIAVLIIFVVALVRLVRSEIGW